MNDFKRYLNGTKLSRLEQVAAMALQGLIARDGIRGTNTPKEYLAEEAVKTAIVLLTETHNEVELNKYTKED
jgi:hypothetical protein